MRTSYLTGLTAGSLLIVTVTACNLEPLTAFTTDTDPLTLAPTSFAAVDDQRGRFREIYCAVAELRAGAFAVEEPCERVLTRLRGEAPRSGRAVHLGPARSTLRFVFVPGLAQECFGDILHPGYLLDGHLQQLGYSTGLISVSGLSSSAHNARQIRDAIDAMEGLEDEQNLVLVGFSKGAVDILEALVSYPDIRPRVRAMISVAGAIGGSPLANEDAELLLQLLEGLSGGACEAGDGGAIASLRPGKRQAWLAHNRLPNEVRYFSLVTFPEPARISTALRSSHAKLSWIDRRNDGQLLFYDQVVPGGVLLGYVNADHWAVALPISDNQEFLAATVADRNRFPREILAEALVRHVEEQLLSGAGDGPVMRTGARSGERSQATHKKPTP